MDSSVALAYSEQTKYSTQSVPSNLYLGFIEEKGLEGLIGLTGNVFFFVKLVIAKFDPQKWITFYFVMMNS